jgi:cytochrome c-type biogenesis protein CcmH/NrfG
LQRAFNKVPTDATVAEHLGDAYLKQNRYREALHMYRRALDLEGPDLPSLREKIKNLEPRLQPQTL